MCVSPRNCDNCDNSSENNGVFQGYKGYGILGNDVDVELESNNFNKVETGKLYIVNNYDKC